MFLPQGVYAAMLTPFSADGSPNCAELKKMVEFLVQSGINGLFPNSSAGEFVHLSQAEKIRVMEAVAQAAGGRVPVAPGVGTSHGAESVFLAKKAKELGCDAVVAAPPYYFKPGEGSVEAYFLSIADNSELPVIIYNIPFFTQPLSYDLVRRLSRHENIVGMKDSSGSMVDFLHFMDVSRDAPAPFSMMAGREEMLYPALAMGAKGCMTASCCILPELMTDIYTAWTKGDLEAARSLQAALLPVVRAMFVPDFPLGFKAAMAGRGFDMGPFKQPLSPGEKSAFNAARQNIIAAMDRVLGPGGRPAV